MKLTFKGEELIFNAKSEQSVGERFGDATKKSKILCEWLLANKVLLMFGDGSQNGEVTTVISPIIMPLYSGYVEVMQIPTGQILSDDRDGIYITDALIDMDKFNHGIRTATGITNFTRGPVGVIAQEFVARFIHVLWNSLSEDDPDFDEDMFPPQAFFFRPTYRPAATYPSLFPPRLGADLDGDRQLDAMFVQPSGLSDDDFFIITANSEIKTDFPKIPTSLTIKNAELIFRRFNPYATPYGFGEESGFQRALPWRNHRQTKVFEVMGDHYVRAQVRDKNDRSKRGMVTLAITKVASFSGIVTSVDFRVPGETTVIASMPIENFLEI